MFHERVTIDALDQRMTSPSPGPRRSRTDYPMTAVFLLALVALIDCLFDYFWSGNGIHGTEGVLLVIVSTLLLAMAAGALVNRWGPGWLHAILEMLIGLDFLGTGAAAYFLEDWVLLALMVLGFLAWLTHLFRRPATFLAAQG
jgi:hypothetical protein